MSVAHMASVFVRVSQCTIVDVSQLKVERLLQWNSAVRILHIFVNLIKVGQFL